MSRKYFGTDGVRGRVGEHPLTVEFALRLASSAARVLAPKGGTVLVGKDTRISGYMFESALEAGFVASGVNVMLIGPLPTPGIAYLTKRFECDFGVVISASHNLYEDNGIKFFDRAGGKLSDDVEAQIEQMATERRFARDRIRTEVRDAFSAFVAARDQLRQTNLNADLALELQSAEEERFRRGATDLLALQIREQAAFDARTLSVDAAAEVFRAAADYRMATAEELTD